VNDGLWLLSFRLVARFPTADGVTVGALLLKGVRMNVCSHTGVSVPECSCRACLQAQIERHMPSVLAAARTPRMEGGIEAVVHPTSADSPSRRRAILSRLRRPRLRRAA
jgi:hypothetical protein